MRKAHFLHKPRTATHPKFFIFVDVETEERFIGKTAQGKEQFSHSFKMGCAAYVRRKLGTHWQQPEFLDVNSPEHFWRWVDSKVPEKSRCLLFAHNVGFDMTILNVFDFMPQFGWTLVNYIIDSPPTLIEFQKCPNNCGMKSGRTWRAISECKAPHKTLQIVDTLNYFRMSLAALGSNLGSEKLEMPKLESGAPDWSILDQPNGRDIWFTYNKQDVQILITAIQEFIEFIETHKLGSFAITQASQSFTAFRTKFMKHKIFIDANENALSTARAAYYGGRVECFKIAKIPGTTYKLDINSMYPHVMATGTFPTKLAGVWDNVSLEEFQQDLQGKFKYCADVYLDTDEPCYPKKDEQGRLTFPTGTFPTNLSTPEIDYAISKGHLKAINRIAFYYHEPLFKEFVEYFYTLRLKAKEKGDEIESFFLKILMNSLYGKFGQNGRKWKTVEDSADQDDIRVWIEVDADTGEIEHFRQIGNVVQQLQGEEESLNSHPAIAAHITAQARMNLWGLIVKAGRKNVFYCDTDSLFTNHAGLCNLENELDDIRLGALKNEGETTNCIIRGLKDYQFGDTNRVKGVKNPNAPISENTYKLEIFRGLNGALRDADFKQVIITRGIKTLKRIYQKGDVQENGIVKPFELELPMYSK